MYRTPSSAGWHQVDGVINPARQGSSAADRPATLFAYDCVQRAFAYRRTFAGELYPPVRACLEEAVRLDPNYAAAWAMLGFAHLDAVRFVWSRRQRGLPRCRLASWRPSTQWSLRRAALSPAGAGGVAIRQR